VEEEAPGVYLIGGEEREREREEKDLLSLARPHLLNFLEPPKIAPQLGSKHSTHEPF
jgi:hypothetical protein